MQITKKLIGKTGFIILYFNRILFAQVVDEI
jgi:hypothetical protein